MRTDIAARPVIQKSAHPRTYRASGGLLPGFSPGTSPGGCSQRNKAPKRINKWATCAYFTKRIFKSGECRNVPCRDLSSRPAVLPTGPSGSGEGPIRPEVSLFPAGSGPAPRSGRRVIGGREHGSVLRAHHRHRIRCGRAVGCTERRQENAVSHEHRGGAGGNPADASPEGSKEHETRPSIWRSRAAGRSGGGSSTASQTPGPLLQNADGPEHSAPWPRPGGWRASPPVRSAPSPCPRPRWMCCPTAGWGRTGVRVRASPVSAPRSPPPGGGHHPWAEYPAREAQTRMPSAG